MSTDQEQAALQNNIASVDDNDLADVSGGWTNLGNCPRKYNRVLCELTLCPYIKTIDFMPDKDHYDKYCDLGYWSLNLHYPQD